jgi:23S rRNA (uracil1939-C5)-methyltransferase
MPETTIESLDHEGRGVAHAGGKALFVDGALPGESVAYTAYKEKHSFDLAHVQAILRVSPFRVAPACPHFGVCGGCSMQHLDPRAQVAAKQRVLEDCLWHIARVRPQTMLSPMQGPTWRYRRRARLSVRLVRKKGGVLVGFHERK